MKTCSNADILVYFKTMSIAYNTDCYSLSNEKDMDTLIRLWRTSLECYPKEIVDKAVERAIKRSEFPPKIATIVKEAESLIESTQKSEFDLWEELENVLYDVSNNASKYFYSDGYRAQERNREIYASLSPEIKAFVKNCGQLVELATADDKTIAITKARFCNALPSIRERIKAQESLPKEFKALSITDTILKKLN